ncbi:MAG TPA: iron-sulfur cluster assembly protein, partial [Candidatus Binatia bacterium]|nr:iron-sulfur cluster assembly protein [Candidatus Binatia bacterium]
MTPEVPRVTEAVVLQALRSVEDPEQRRDIVTLGLVRDLEIHGADVTFTLGFSGQAPATKVAVHSGASRAL